MQDKVERYIMSHKKIAVGDAYNQFDMEPAQLHRVIYKLRKLGYPITSNWIFDEEDDVKFVVYSIPSKWSKKSLIK